MHALFIHSDFIEYWAKKETKMAVKLTEEEKHNKVEECLVVFSSFEEADDSNEEAIASNLIKEATSIAEQVNTKKIVLYPFVHLLFGKKPSKPKTAIKIFELAKAELEKQKYEVFVSPFGWYKAFDVKCKGHPLSELSRVISADGASELKGPGKDIVESKAVAAEKKLKSKWYVLDEKGEVVDGKDFNFSKHKSLNTFYKYETSKDRAVKDAPPHIRLMQTLELVDYEPGSDAGNLRWYPKGKLVKKLLENETTKIIKDYGGMEVETPIMYDYEHPNLKKYMDRFPARQYVVKSDEKEYFLRFAACFGQYLMKHDMSISYKNLPLRMYELTHYSFRREQTGELAGIKRLRTFTMPDIHTLAKDMEQAKEEYIEQFKLCLKWMDDLGVEYDIAIRFVKSFYDENQDFVKELVKLANRPMLLEIWDDQFFYFVMKCEFSVSDTQGKAATLSTVQIDVDNSCTFEIDYADKDNTMKNPLILHASIPGAIERNIWALLEYAAAQAKKGKKAMLPYWLSPTQVRLISLVTDKPELNKFVEDVYNKLRSSNIRVDIDDREESVGKKIRQAEKEWIPYTLVIGEKEIQENSFQVRDRSTGKQESMLLDDLINKCKELQADHVFEHSSLPSKLSIRPVFRS